MSYWQYMEKDEEYNAWLKDHHERRLAQQVGRVSSGAINDGQWTAGAIASGGITATVSQADVVATSSMMPNASVIIAASMVDDTSTAAVTSINAPPTTAAVDMIFINASSHINPSSPHTDAATFAHVPTSKRHHPLDESSLNVIAAADRTAISVQKRARKVQSDKGVKRGSRKPHAQSVQIENVMSTTANAES
ncbi:uncharacterized protein LAESUDRAFT_714145 [Laetiporus sulphureus 93-53]|uniref:Uncharacterized protein n=1 Tax=Laetiporus sulphureus 93-53 TaxID=1314785 RepID=A0A165EC26_9APHY|nr:uncharacterized protein LAESUDRAFT_714145 [Laetiporus sulphureus 93-53]KZT06702.1 hypothetical protein LAESUDRAFT_714145 [Laetiporus sulphureus 93-53]